VVPRSSRIGRRSAQTTGSGIRYLIAIDILRIHESRPVFTDAPHPESQLAISGDLARIEARYWLLLPGSGCVVGHSDIIPSLAGNVRIARYPGVAIAESARLLSNLRDYGIWGELVRSIFAVHSEPGRPQEVRAFSSFSMLYSTSGSRGYSLVESDRTHGEEIAILSRSSFVGTSPIR
jgi:hypothetical protein